MIKIFCFVFLLAIWHSFLFFGKKLGLSVILFILPLLGIIFFVLKKYKIIKNKKGLLLGIPIILLSCHYFIYNAWFFRKLNLIIIPILFLLMYIMTIKPTFKIPTLIKECFYLISESLASITDVIRIIYDNVSKKTKISPTTKKRIKSFIIILPVVLLVLWLLTSADMVFDSIIGGFFNGIHKFFDIYLADNLLGRIVIICLIFLYISGTLYFLCTNYSSNNKEESTETKKINLDTDTIKMLFIILTIIYVVFDFIQIKSLIFHSISNNIHYAEYARQGFFQLMFVSLINLSLLLFSKRYYNEDNTNKFLKIMSILIIVLTLVIIISSFLRMNLYESQYGYTLLRLLVYTTLITEIILLIPTSLYILKDNYNIVTSYMTILIIVYVIINFINVDKLIATRNIKRYYDKKDIDIEYLENYSSDNLGELVEFYKEVDDKEIKESLDNYFKELNLFINYNGIQEFNLSIYKGEKLIKKYR